MAKIEALLNSVTESNQIKLIREPSPIRFFYGRDADNHMIVSIVTKFSCSFPKSTESLGLNQIFQGGLFWNNIVLKDELARTAYFAFCQDLFDISVSASDEKTCLKSIVNQISSWKRMFSNRTKLLSEQETMGLFGELYFLSNYIFKKFGLEEGLKAWSGPLGLSKDFAKGLDWWEVKTSKATAVSVSIHSHEQLLSQNPGYLVIIKVEPMSEAFQNGIANINDLFDSIRLKVKDYPELLEIFFDRIRKARYWPDERYGQFRYQVVDISFYLVDSDFPRLPSPTFYGTAVSKISYDLIINSLSKYKVQNNG